LLIRRRALTHPSASQPAAATRECADRLTQEPGPIATRGAPLLGKGDAFDARFKVDAPNATAYAVAGV
jgi:hypothetical protein